MNRLATAILMAATIVACDSTPADDAEWIVADVVATGVATDARARTAGADDQAAILAEFHVGESGRVRFIDESVSGIEGGVGVLTIGVSLATGMQELRLSPLELYMALAPGQEAPARLREHHAFFADREGRATAEPRRFRLEDGLLGPADAFAAGPQLKVFAQTEGFMSDCQSGTPPDAGSTWADGFCPNIAANLGGYDWCSAVSAVQPATVYAVAGSAGQRWLGACIPTLSLNWVVQAEQGAGSWSTVSGTSTLVAADEWVEYTSSSLQMQNFRSKITSQGGLTIQIGAARD